MKKTFLIFALLFISQIGFSQVYINSGAEMYVSDNFAFVTKADFVNNGTTTLNDNSRFVFDGDFENNNIFNFQNGSNKGIFEIGSGEATSNLGQDLKFNGGTTEHAPYIILNKTGGTAAISRGHLKVLETLIATSGTLNANTSIGIDPNDANNTNYVQGLTFASDATNTAVIDESTNGTVNNVITERYVPVTNRAFRLFSGSVSTTGSIRDNLMEGGQVTAVGGTDDPRPGYGTHITGSATLADGFDVTLLNNVSMFKYSNPDAGLFSDLPNTSGTIAAGESYFLFIRGGRDFDLTTTGVGLTPTRLRLLGNAHIGNFNASTISAMPTLASDVITQYYGSIGNPYQAQVNLEDVLSSNLTTGIDKTQVYIFDPTFGTQNGAWITVNFVLNGSDGSYDFDSVVPEEIGVTNVNQFLQPNQAFFIEKDNTVNPAEVRFEESFKKDTEPSLTNGVFSENNNSLNDFSIRMNIYNADDSSILDGILLKFQDTYSDDFIQDEDAVSFINSNETFSTVSNDGNFLSFDKRNIDLQGDIIQLNVENYNATNYEFKIKIDNNQGQDDVYLIDNYLDTSYLIDADIFTHSFDVDSNIPESIDTFRFQLGINTTTLDKDDFESNGITVYPVPVKGIVNVNLAQFNGIPQTIKLFDITGKIVKTKKVSNASSNIIDIDLTGLSSGVYIIQLDTDSGQFQQKIIKE